MIGFIEKRKHDKLRTLLSSFADDEVSEGERRDVETHLAQCTECAAELASIRGMSQLMGRLPEIALPRSFRLTQAPAPSHKPAYGVWTGTFATAAAAVLLVFLLVGDAMGLVTQSPVQLERSQRQESSAPAAPMAPAAAPAPGDMQRSSAEPAMALESAPSAAASSAAAPMAPAPELAPASAIEETTSPAGGSHEADSSSEPEPAAAVVAPTTAMTIDATPTAEIGIATTMGLAAIEPEPAPSVAETDMAKAESSLQQSDAPKESLSFATSQPEQASAPVGTGLPELGSDGAGAARGSTINQNSSEEETAGLSLPVRQLQVASAAVLVVLLTTTIAVYRRRRLP